MECLAFPAVLISHLERNSFSLGLSVCTFSNLQTLAAIMIGSALTPGSNVHYIIQGSITAVLSVVVSDPISTSHSHFYS